MLSIFVILVELSFIIFNFFSKVISLVFIYLISETIRMLMYKFPFLDFVKFWGTFKIIW